MTFRSSGPPLGSDCQTISRKSSADIPRMPLHGIEDAPLDRRQAQTFRQDGLTAAWADRPSGSLSWEIGCTPGGDGVDASLGIGEDAEGLLVGIKGFNSSLAAEQQNRGEADRRRRLAFIACRGEVVLRLLSSPAEKSRGACVLVYRPQVSALLGDALTPRPASSDPRSSRYSAVE